MNAFSTPQDPFSWRCNGDRSPVGMPPTEARVILQITAITLKQLGADTGSLEVCALGDALEEMASGDTEAACQAVQEAAAYRAMRA